MCEVGDGRDGTRTGKGIGKMNGRGRGDLAYGFLGGCLYAGTGDKAGGLRQIPEKS